MTDFGERLRRGLKAHEEANAAKKEIMSVISALDDAVDRETGGEIGIKLTSSYVGNAFSAARIAALATGTPAPALEMEHWIAAFSKNHKDLKPLSLARWEMDSTGYPCTIRFDRERLDAYDRTSLESALGELLEYPGTGGMIGQLHRQILKIASE